VKLKSNSLFLAFSLFFLSCSDKASYSPKPENIVEKRIPFYFNKVKIERIERDIAFLSNGQVFNRNGNELNISLLDREREFGFVATKKDDLIASVTTNNSAQLWKDGNQVFNFDFDRISSVDRRLPKPLFRGDNILYFTLDGKIAIFSIQMNKILRVINISYNTEYSNVIDYRLSPNNSLTLLTHKSIMHIENGEEKKVSVDMRGAIFEDDSFFAITKNGEVRKYDYNLKVLESVRFPFAYFVSWGKVDNKIYLIESNGYLIELESDFSERRVFSEDVDLTYENCFFTPQKFICDEKIFYLPLTS
jgi:hypothetical protein